MKNSPSTDYDAAQPDPRKPERPFCCPRCGGANFGRDTATSRGQVVALDTVRCHGEHCYWRGKWPPMPGRPLISDEPATGHIHLRVTLARKNAYVRAAKPQKLTEWIFAQLDQKANFLQS